MHNSEQRASELETLSIESKQERFIGNECYRDPCESISKALALYKEKHPENPLQFSGYPRVSDSHFLKMAARIQMDRLQEKPEAMKRGFEAYLPPELADYIQGQFGDDLHESFRYDIKKRIEDTAENIDGPLGVQEIFYIFLSDKKGNISEALEAAHHFFKDLARGLQGYPLYDSEQGIKIDLPNTRDKFVKNGAQVLADEWMKTNIKDDLAIIRPYQQLESRLYESDSSNRNVDYNESLRNQIGRMYHFFGILDSLDKMTPMQVAVSTMGEYAMYFKIHGYEKFLADANILLNLKEIYREFNKYKGTKTDSSD